jgi:hypothetical protein
VIEGRSINTNLGTVDPEEGCLPVENDCISDEDEEQRHLEARLRDLRLELLDQLQVTDKCCLVFPTRIFVR